MLQHGERSSNRAERLLRIERILYDAPLKVGATLEMKPWIRQWGYQCEVLSPPELRAEIAEEMRRAAGIYGENEPTLA